MENKIITIRDIEESIYDANLDSEYREALGHAMMTLEYVNDSPFNMYFGTQKQKEEIERVETMPLDSNQISEIIHLMMYEMRNDFQYGKFKPVAVKYINISEKMKKENVNNDKKNKPYEKPKANVYSAYANMNKIITITSKILKQNNMFNESREMIERATLSYSYDEALNIIKEYVDITDERELEDEEYE